MTCNWHGKHEYELTELGSMVLHLDFLRSLFRLGVSSATLVFDSVCIFDVNTEATCDNGKIDCKTEKISLKVSIQTCNIFKMW